jgi:hypothetical protein
VLTSARIVDRIEGQPIETSPDEIIVSEQINEFNKKLMGKFKEERSRQTKDDFEKRSCSRS